jgi:hypothetical protein
LQASSLDPEQGGADAAPAATVADARLRCRVALQDSGGRSGRCTANSAIELMHSWKPDLVYTNDVVAQVKQDGGGFRFAQAGQSGLVPA